MSLIDLNNLDALEQHLAVHDDSFEKIEVPEQYGEIKDGKYTAKVSKIEFKESQPKDGKEPEIYIKWELTLTSQEYLNRKVWRNNMLATETNREWLKKDLALCGMVLQKLSDLPKRLSELLDLELDVFIKNKEGQSTPNCYINGLHGVGKGSFKSKDIHDLSISADNGSVPF